MRDLIPPSSWSASKAIDLTAMGSSKTQQTLRVVRNKLKLNNVPKEPISKWPIGNIASERKKKKKVPYKDYITDSCWSCEFQIIPSVSLIWSNTDNKAFCPTLRPSTPQNYVIITQWFVTGLGYMSQFSGFC